MRSLLDPEYRSSVLERIERLTTDSLRRWGTMSLGQMLCHVSDQLRFAVGDLAPSAEPSGPLTWKPVQWFGIAVSPWPKGRIETSPQLLQTDPSDLARDIDRLKTLIDLFVNRAGNGSLGPHPMFGELSTELWGRLAGRHLDHHLRQFGV